jgi:hypothetical protein
MSHILTAFVLKEKDLSPFIRRKQLPQGFALVPADEWLVSQFPQLEGGTEGFSKMFCNNNPVAAVHTDYFGGVGEQSADFYDGKIVHSFDSYSPRPINTALSKLGVTRSGTEDEFDAIHLGKYRNTSEVLGEPRDLKRITEDEVRELWDDVLSSRDTTGRFSHFYPYADKWMSGGHASDRVPGLTIYRGDGPRYVDPFYIDETGHYYMKEDATIEVLDNMLIRMAETILAQNPDDAFALEKAGDLREKKLVLEDVDLRIRVFLSRRNFYIAQPDTL